METNFYLVIITIILIGLGGIVYRLESLARQVSETLKEISKKLDKN